MGYDRFGGGVRGRMGYGQQEQLGFRPDMTDRTTDNNQRGTDDQRGMGRMRPGGQGGMGQTPLGFGGLAPLGKVFKKVIGRVSLLDLSPSPITDSTRTCFTS